MTSYSATRDSEQLRYLEVDIAAFIQRYQSRPAGIQRRTLFLFPGGMGSQLLRARTGYQVGGPAHQTFQYDTVWVTPLTFLGDALNLKMHNVNGVYQDLADHIIIPYGTIEFLGLTPYMRFIEWCELNNIDWFIFGWDWRRRPEETVDFFLGKFLPRFKALVEPVCGPDVLKDYALVGHSFGGMIVSLMLQQNNPLLSTLGRAVTVASPFYGYDGQIHRWFEGEPLLNHIGPVDITPEVIETIASLPGVYILPYLDHHTFQNNKAALAADPDYPLHTYPSHDFANGTLSIDPFSPGAHRYPQNIGFMMGELGHGLTTYRKVAHKPLPQYIDRFFNIRGIQSAPQTTPGSVSWGLLTGPNNPNTSPIGTGPGTPGDGTLPAWSTRLVTLPSDQVIPIVGDITHMFLMEEDALHQALAGVLAGEDVQMMAKPSPSSPPVQPATREEVFEFLRELQQFRSRGEKPVDRKAIQEFLSRQSLGSLHGISSRIMMDILKSPTAEAKRKAPRTGTRRKPPAAPKRVAKKRKPAGKTRKSIARKSVAKKRVAKKQVVRKAKKKKKTSRKK